MNKLTSTFGALVNGTRFVSAFNGLCYTKITDTFALRPHRTETFTFYSDDVVFECDDCLCLKFAYADIPQE